ncbi:MAG TPA: GSCFA domain-containing protein [Chitinophagaceae bacterium]|nr:GSCFA domain-containing protein [Chitinophagaceae bacterium]
MMDFMLPFNLPKASHQINHQQNILSIGSCFTEHIGNALKDLKFNVLQNPNGILFDPTSVCSSLLFYIENKEYKEKDLFKLNELWNSWQHHSRFSGTDKIDVLKKINESQAIAHQFLKEAHWLIITLGSSFSYRLVNENLKPVDNCHRAPAQKFQKYLIPINSIIDDLNNTLQQLLAFNKKLSVIFTISPVRHIRDGVVDNNRSKARLIEAVHQTITAFDNASYFPAYEIVIDVLRDYRFYDIDLVHPNYPATEFVLEKFLHAYTSNDTLSLIEGIKKIVVARKHKSQNPDTEAHKIFLQTHLQKALQMQKEHPYLDFEKEIAYFTIKH